MSCLQPCCCCCRYHGRCLFFLLCLSCVFTVLVSQPFLQKGIETRAKAEVSWPQHGQWSVRMTARKTTVRKNGSWKHGWWKMLAGSITKKKNQRKRQPGWQEDGIWQERKGRRKWTSRNDWSESETGIKERSEAQTRGRGSCKRVRRLTKRRVTRAQETGSRFVRKKIRRLTDQRGTR